MPFHALEVADVEELTDEAVAITFRVPPELAPAYAAAPGQHVSVRTPGDPERRSYSLCTAPAAGSLRIGVKRLPGGAFSDGVVRTLRPGDRLEVMTPAGRFTATPDPAARRWYGAVAAGSGITPVLPILTALLEGEPGSRVTLVRVDRTQRSVMFLDEVHDLKDRFPERLQLLHVLTREEQDVALLTGRLDADRTGRLLDAFGLHGIEEWFVCGPQPLVADLRSVLPGRVHAELFHADAPPRVPVAAPAVAGAARVVVRRDGRSSELDLRPDGPPVLEAALAVRGDLPWACRGGVCGTCRARLVEGTVAMDAAWALEPDEVAAGHVLACQAHPTSDRVVLDFDG
ncbi:2Fe-2S iron-sulfur cluster binding domain-containing protein [Nocardioides sp. zg-579]|uniref:2Fe-2S iron-sulfur cluster binding domain-containing protein n=1 Tax=Nocardioides marmotae TaxID=2663857 RepID=A0A6I3JBK2_9ACTN|nr:2Fe-2S iron-sulfur cluster-binding protein [Nocardioides marmotae]MCR6031859.1 2Fe-2S iron-sulfur cluster binding domain-containing protein [Gordonia jinghuaiqii]MTB95500.1 2Fe-2S iron-sulfur cluster binding domain-containing protein [Nocardioides marmotae]QKE00931.1 2Fe-2S iron-sulfur cluster binding domain-containing protein [Nocardioides marmotae]